MLQLLHNEMIWILKDKSFLNLIFHKLRKNAAEGQLLQAPRSFAGCQNNSQVTFTFTNGKIGTVWWKFSCLESQGDESIILAIQQIEIFFSCHSVFNFLKNWPSQFLSHWELAEPLFWSKELSCLPYKNQNLSYLAGVFTHENAPLESICSNFVEHCMLLSSITT